ncbi:S8 family serine peptidase [Kineosporia rhizophila]|uniref:S8 family serine peptidase n=1 Tax=Kineosporia rhizophila TaxID=84633 RepID=UPI001E3DD874|nr:S8 family serine peptidase [Kineosporia rhizophila]
MPTVSTPSPLAQALRPERAWPLTQGEGVVVAVLGTGFDVSSPHLRDQVTLGENEVSRGRVGVDCVGHGTFVAGLVAARPRTGSTVAGVAPGAHVYGITVTDDTGATGPDVIAKGIRAAVRAEVKIILVSVVSSRSSARLQAAVQDAVDAGALVIAPAVADDQTIQGPVYPAALDGVLAVSDPSAGSAARGFLAPGQAVTSVCPGGVCVGTGAAYSAAAVAATAALMDAYHPGLTRRQRIGRLTETAYPIDAGPTPSSIVGLIDPYAAVTAVLPQELGTVDRVPVAAPVAPMPPPPGEPAWIRALIVAGAGLSALALALWSAAACRARSDRDE